MENQERREFQVGIKEEILEKSYDFTNLLKDQYFIGFFVEQLIKNGSFDGIEHLNLSENEVKVDGIKQILLKLKFINLKQLNLRNSNINIHRVTQKLINKSYKNFNDGITCIVESNLPNLVELNLSGNRINKVGTQKLSKSYWPDLQKLILSSNSINNEALKYLIMANWKKLSILHLGSNKITNDGMKVLARACWKQLKYLNLEFNLVADDGLNLLSKMGLYSLKKIDLSVSKEGRTTDKIILSGLGLGYLAKFNCRKCEVSVADEEERLESSTKKIIKNLKFCKSVKGILFW